MEGEDAHSCGLGSLPRIKRAPSARAGGGTRGTLAVVAWTPRTMDSLGVAVPVQKALLESGLKLY